MLVGFAGFGRGHLNSLLRARIGILDRFAVRRRQVIEFVDTVADGLRLPRDIFLARERIHATPEAFPRLGLQWILASGGVGLGGWLRSRLAGCRLHGGRRGLRIRI